MPDNTGTRRSTRRSTDTTVSSGQGWADWGSTSMWTTGSTGYYIPTPGVVRGGPMPSDSLPDSESLIDPIPEPSSAYGLPNYSTEEILRILRGEQVNRRDPSQEVKYVCPDEELQIPME
jgi:hypothetical protein